MNPRNSQAVAVRPSSTVDVAAMPRELRQLRAEAAMIANSPLVPESIRGDADSVLLVAMRGKSLGISLVTSLAEIHVIEGRTMCSAQIAGAVARRHCDWWTEESSSERCTIAGHRHGHPERVSRVTFTIDDAKRAGVLDIEWRKTKWDPEKRKATVTDRWVEGDGPKPAWVDPANRDVRKSWRENWHRWPANMLFARALTNWVRQNCGEALLGIDVDENLAAVPDTVDTTPGQPARADIIEDQAEDDIVDIEVIEPAAPSARPAPSWPETWAARCTELGCDKPTSKALIHFATQGLTVLSVDVPEGHRADCDLLLTKWAADRPADVNAWLEEPEAE